MQFPKETDSWFLPFLLVETACAVIKGASVMMINPDSSSVGGRDWCSYQLCLGEILGCCCNLLWRTAGTGPKGCYKIKLALPSRKDLRALLRMNSCVELFWISRLDYPLSSQSIKDKVINMLYQKKKRLNHNFSDHLPEASCGNWLVAVGNVLFFFFCSAYINKTKCRLRSYLSQKQEDTPDIPQQWRPRISRSTHINTGITQSGTNSCS